MKRNLMGIKFKVRKFLGESLSVTPAEVLGVESDLEVFSALFRQMMQE